MGFFKSTLSIIYGYIIIKLINKSKNNKLFKTFYTKYPDLKLYLIILAYYFFLLI